MRHEERCQWVCWKISLTFTSCLSRVWSDFIQTSRRHCSHTSPSLCSRVVPLLNESHPLLTVRDRSCRIKPSEKNENLQNLGINFILWFEFITWRVSECEALKRERKGMKNGVETTRTPTFLSQHLGILTERSGVITERDMWWNAIHTGLIRGSGNC